MKQYCLGFCFSFDDKEVALIRKAKPDWQKGKLNGVGGFVEEGETPYLAMIREFEEETGYLLKDWTHRGTMVIRKERTNDEVDQVISVFKGYADPRDLRTTTNEEVVIVDVDKLPKDTLFNLKWWIPAVLDPDQQYVFAEYL